MADGREHEAWPVRVHVKGDESFPDYVVRASESCVHRVTSVSSCCAVEK